MTLFGRTFESLKKILDMKKLIKILILLLMVFAVPLICALAGPDFGYAAWSSFKFGLLIECLLVVCMPWWGLPLVVLLIAMIWDL